MQNTASIPTVTHTNTKSNIFQKSKRIIAGSGLLEKLNFVQWRITETMQHHTNNVNVIRLAALLAAFPRMGITGFDFSQSQLAKKFGELYQVSAPARKSICVWEKTLCELGFLHIPEHKASKPKTRVFSEKFWNMARVNMPKLSYTCVPVTWYPTNGDEQYIPKEQGVNNNPVIKKRAYDIESKQVEHSRAPSQNKKFCRPPKNRNSAPKKLNRFENSVSWWLFQNKHLESYREGVLLFARFLEMRGSDYYHGLEKAWKDCRDSARPGLVAEMLRHLRAVDESSVPGGGGVLCYIPQNNHERPPLRTVPTDNLFQEIPGESKPKNPEIMRLRIALVFGGQYEGPHRAIVNEFRAASDDRRNQILNALEKIC